MRLLKNVEVARRYGVSEATVINWIHSAKRRQNKLRILDVKDRSLIIDTPVNSIVLKQLADKGKKYRNRLRYKKIKAKKEFYKNFTETQIIDILQSIKIYKEIPNKYTYFGEGARYWDNYVTRVYEENIPMTLNRTIAALGFDFMYLNSLINDYEYVNVIDIGVGNGYAVKDLILHLKKLNKFKKYIAIDISPDILKILKRNFRRWFGMKFSMRSYIQDITNENIQKFVYSASHSLDKEDSSCINLVLFIGSSIENQMDYLRPLSLIKDSLDKNDVFFLGQLLDDDEEKISLSFHTNKFSVKDPDLDMERIVVNLLGIKDSHYSFERYYDEKQRARIIAIRLKYDIDIEIETKNFKDTIRLNNKDKLIVFRHNHHTNYEVIETLKSLGFNLLHVTVSPDEKQGMYICKIKPKE